MTNPVSPDQLKKLAELCVKTGLGLERGQDLIMTAPIEALPLVRLVTKEAYKAGAGLVTALFSDQEMTLIRYQHGHEDSFDKAAGWLYDGMGKAFDNNAARLAISGENPMLLANEDAQKVGRVNKATSMASTPMRKRIVEFDINWNIISYPTIDWAKLVFPDDSEQVAVAKLAQAIFAASRVDQNDPIDAWKKHNAVLAGKSKWLNENNFSALHFTGPGTNLTIGLAKDHEWMGGASRAKNGIVCNPNIPSEEVFTTPHALKVEGYVSSTKPLSYNGTLIDDISVKFKDGRIIEARAGRGEEILHKMLDTDEGASRLGEVALVPHSSPISQSDILFYNTLFDENASCHIALGQCYTKCFRGGDKISDEQVIANGGNSSQIHVDWMIGSGDIDIDGISRNGDRIPVFRQGEWA
ncbi:Aminopeptidase S (Leu, Val, Phe, Tyr preference) [hydrothermal vent metagenome]|uniref:Aminopeptidase S (Leu, Val, Phe, Tyr preference) n=1 Tax=hydrothermal vent metagenome TaxID=652676 RepID=A0A3B0TVP3_9ZZZZ